MDKPTARIIAVAGKGGVGKMYERCGAVLNRVADTDAARQLMLGEIPLLAAIGEDDTQMELDILGKTVFDLPETSPVFVGVRQALAALDII